MTWILMVRLLSAAYHPYNIDVFENKMIWSSPDIGQVAMMDKFGRSVNMTIQSGLSMPHAVKIFHQHRYDRTSMLDINAVRI